MRAQHRQHEAPPSPRSPDGQRRAHRPVLRVVEALFDGRGDDGHGAAAQDRGLGIGAEAPGRRSAARRSSGRAGPAAVPPRGTRPSGLRQGRARPRPGRAGIMADAEQQREQHEGEVDVDHARSAPRPRCSGSTRSGCRSSAFERAGQDARPRHHEQRHPEQPHAFRDEDRQRDQRRHQAWPTCPAWRCRILAVGQADQRRRPAWSAWRPISDHISGRP